MGHHESRLLASNALSVFQIVSIQFASEMYSYPHPPQNNIGQDYVSQEIQQWFTTVDQDHSGQINWQELQRALISGPGTNFSDKICKFLISLFDSNHSGTIGVGEFQKLFDFVNQWLQIFRSFDKDGSGFVEHAELSQAFQQMGYGFSPGFVTFLMSRSETPQQRMSVDEFILICIQIQKLTQGFGVRDPDRIGTINISYEEFMQLAISCSL